MEDPDKAKEGMFVTNLMVSLPKGAIRKDVGNSLIQLVEKYKSSNFQIITSSIFGYECDFMFMCLSKDADAIWQFEQDLKKLEEQARIDTLDATDDEKSEMMTQWLARISVYEKHKLYPEIPNKEYICFYPMSKKRESHANWYALPFDERAKYMRSHGALGRKYSGKIIQLITGATGLTDYEWGVTLVSDSLFDIKEIVYEMRYDQASALYGEFGHFTIGKIVDIVKVLS